MAGRRTVNRPCRAAACLALFGLGSEGKDAVESLSDKTPGGWRARIGVIVPPSNTVNETEFNRLKPDGVTFHFTRSPLHADPAADDFAGMMDDLAAAGTALASCKVDLIAYGCTSGSMACPADRLIGKLRQAAGVDAVSTAGAILAALGALGVSRITMATPYTAATNAHEKHYLEEHGITILADSGLGLNTDLAGIQKISQVPPAEVYAHASAVDRPDAEALLICCTDFNAIDVIEPLEDSLGKPVISSNSATLWACLRAAGIEDRIAGCGRLLRAH